MASWAIVIGIDRYAIQDAALGGAVRDALDVREWLFDPQGGNVPEANLALVLGPAEGAPDPGVEAAAPDRNSATKAVAELIQRSGGAGERLYFYYSGHGISARTGFSDEDAMLFSDFEWLLPDNSWSLRSLWEYFATFQFQDQIMLVDACRNAPRIQEVRIGHWPRPRQRDVGTPPAQQFILYATSPGLRAAEEGAPGDEHAAFTRVLLNGLRGAGRAKTFDSAAQEYLVRWDALADYVVDAMEELKKNVAEGAKELIQIPQQAGARGVAGRPPNPAIVSIPVDRVPDPELQLDVVLRPEEVVGVAEVRLLDDAGAPVETRTQVPGLPVRFTLPPRTYLLHALAPQYDTLYYRPPVDLYGNREIALDLKPAAGTAPAPQAGAQAATGRLVAISPDPRLPIEVANAAGQVVASACGRVETEQAPGAYQVRVRGADGRPLVLAVALTAGEEEEVELSMPAPEPAVTRIVQRSGLELADNHTLSVSELVAPIGGAGLSTVLGLAGLAALLGVADEGHKLRSLGSRAMRAVLDKGARSGIHVLVGVDGAADGETAGRLGNVRLTCWPILKPVPEASVAPTPLDADPGLGEHALAAEPGNHWLAIERTGANPIVLPLSVLDDRVTLVVVTLVTDGHPGVFEFIPPRIPTAEVDLPFMRQVELVEQLAKTPQLYAAEPLARELITTRPTPPVAATLGAYLLLRLGHSADLDDVTQRLTVDYGQLSDGHVLRAEYLASVGRPTDAEASIERALEAGSPIFGEGITRLLDGVAQFHNDHARAQLVSAIHDRYAHGSLFSAWHPPQITRGQPLTP